MALLPSTASIADLFTRPLPTIFHHRYTQLVIGDDPITPTPLSTSVATATVAPTPTVDSVTVTTTVVASASVPTAATLSDSVPSLHPTFALDIGASISRTSDFALEIAQASYGLIRSAALTNSVVKALAPDPYTLITGEDPTFDLSFPDSDSVDTVEFASTLVYSSFRQFGTATLVFLSDANSKLITILVEPTQVDWLHWIPLPRLTPTESYFHIFGRDYLQAFALLHLIPIWIYYLVHSVVNLEE